jgi:hypothetical protein
MGDDMDGAGMTRIEGKRTTSHSFSTAILAILFKAERVHR